MSSVSKIKEKSGRKWRWLALGTVVFFILAGIVFLLSTVGVSKRHEQVLNDRFGWANQYTPPADGSIASQRVEGFIRVRQAVQPNCAEYQAVLDDIIELEALENNPDISAGDKASQSIGAFKGMFSFAPKMLAFMDTRNISLLAQEMGLGEYMYIYLAAYGEQLAAESESRYAAVEQASISPRTRNEYVLILGNQLAALEAADPADAGVELMAILQQEIRALKDGSHPSPWPNGVEGMSAESLAPYREQLTELFCSGIVRIELLQKNRGLNFGG